LRTENIQIWGEIGVFSRFFRGDVCFWAKNGGWWVNLQGLGKTGKKKTFKNVQKRSKTFKNVQKRSKTFKNIQKYSNFE
jgi:hypothetical protein